MAVTVAVTCLADAITAPGWAPLGASATMVTPAVSGGSDSDAIETATSSVRVTLTWSPGPIWSKMTTSGPHLTVKRFPAGASRTTSRDEAKTETTLAVTVVVSTAMLPGTPTWYVLESVDSALGSGPLSEQDGSASNAADNSAAGMDLIVNGFIAFSGCRGCRTDCEDTASPVGRYWTLVLCGRPDGSELPVGEGS